MTEVVPQFDSVIHARHRLQICSLLGGVDALSFATVQETLLVSDYVVSKHVKVLVEAGYVATRKERHGGRPQTWLSLTTQGHRALEAHLAELRRITDLGVG
ncbi:transcriptional regulator [Ornithinimicrobium faecis]|uniref:Transcriptional regulator n=1 Tax=Ornithinimicrobium faecis TaxID=2934158 RepID=A0ABY4YWM7_9MICO|nr:transcriptional regulator [Ornithinimicrobium sp. HY1793]USQ81145.1 transcriptional regulator [Ornithinimicrobium sp. HY1793]